MLCIWALAVVGLLGPAVQGQELNIIPDLLNPYLFLAEDRAPINFLANISEKIFNFQRIGLSFEPKLLRNSYDFIIVGGGTAGSVIANRLSENKKWNILVLEAGQPESIVNFVPVLAAYSIRTNYDWGYIAEKTPGSCLSSENERCPFHAGRALGGSSTTNYMLFTRGNKHDFDEWEARGNEGWGYKDVLPFFKKIEEANIDGFFDPEFRGKNGEMKVTFPPYRSGLVDFFVQAAQEVGFEQTDYNGETQLGVSYIQSNLKNGRRHSAASAFLHPIFKKRKNLHIITSAMVSKILINPETKTAMGVEFKRDDQTYSVFAQKEVILSAGALRSPQLLMLSGIGPEHHLKDLGIDVLKDLPVGERFFDHNVFIGLIFTTNTSNLALHDKRIGLIDVLEFIEGKGQLTTPVNIGAIAYGKMENSPLHPEQPDYELFFYPGSVASEASLASAYRIKKDVLKKFAGPLRSTRLDHYTIAVQQMRPKSSGYIKLRDKNVESHPLFFHNYFTEPEDVEYQLAGVHAGIKIGESDIMKGIGSKIYTVKVPACEHFEFGEDDYWRCAIRAASIGVHHQTGTCRMGPKDSEDAVVDNKLRVHGIQRLRVVDNSIIPSHICAHTHAAALMIGEKASHIIKEFWADYYDD